MTTVNGVNRAAGLTVTDVCYTHPDGTVALDGVRFTVNAGQRVALLGPNGAGKTTLARLLNGLELATSGSVSIDGVAITRATQNEIRRKVQLLFASSDDQLFMPTVAQDVAFGPANLGLDQATIEQRQTRALRAVDATRLADKAPQRLSTGEKKRAALAGVLAMEPDIIVLDEPTAGLDPSGKRHLLNHLQSLEQTQLIITHDIAFAAQACTEAIIINRGTVTASGPIESLLSDETLMAANDLALPYGFSLPGGNQPG